MALDTMDFSDAVRRLKNGSKLYRLAWINLQPPLSLESANQIPVAYIHACGHNIRLTYTDPFFPEQSWQAAAEDIFATDWIVATETK